MDDVQTYGYEHYFDPAMSLDQSDSLMMMCVDHIVDKLAELGVTPLDRQVHVDKAKVVWRQSDDHGEYMDTDHMDFLNLPFEEKDVVYRLRFTAKFLPAPLE